GGRLSCARAGRAKRGNHPVRADWLEPGWGSAGKRRSVVSRLVCGQPRDLSFPVLTQDDQWISGMSFGRRLRHVIRFNGPDHDNLQMPLHETLRAALMDA